ncbi:uncharacterized protein LOC129942239 [Eupeodes corollae]|uniref:uncharacterized protein LOC129942239 n=1 Tax=Eupeodes corollae TaxID=290404 RepID=UPI0024917FDF|nr:uncharacterized protein LOC129942239 [Eupeodes corollae]
MIQIRNKYHLEKKRLETQRNDNPKGFAESKWPLFELLGFLQEHIPVRRSFRTMRCKRKYSESEYVIKSEQDTDGSDAERTRDSEYRNARKGQARSYGNSTQQTKYRNSPYFSASRNACGPAATRLSRMPRQVYASRHAQAIYQRKMETPVRSNLPPGSEKFHAFGQFLTSSLIELPETEALVLIDQFTSELVQVYLSKHNENNKHRDDEDDDDAVEEVDACNGHDDVLITG